MVPEGTRAEDLFEQIARENNGFVLRTYYPEYKTYEIVAVKIGNDVLVKGDPKRVAAADYSRFSDPEAVRTSLIMEAARSTGGIHFFLGEGGIPIVMGEKRKIDFPNAKEMRVTGKTFKFSLKLTDDKLNPLDLRALDNIYAGRGGLRLSNEARRMVEQRAVLTRLGMMKKAAAAHGENRTKELLPDTSVLILNKDTGELLSSSEFAAMARTEGFAAPQFQTLQFTIVGIEIPVSQGLTFAPMDGSAFRSTYEYAKLFDGKVEDFLKIRSRPIIGFMRKQDSWTREPEQEKPKPELHAKAVTATASKGLPMKAASLQPLIQQNSTAPSREVRPFVPRPAEPSRAMRLPCIPSPRHPESFSQQPRKETARKQRKPALSPNPALKTAVSFESPVPAPRFAKSIPQTKKSALTVSRSERIHRPEIFQRQKKLPVFRPSGKRPASRKKTAALPIIPAGFSSRRPKSVLPVVLPVFSIGKSGVRKKFAVAKKLREILFRLPKKQRVFLFRLPCRIPKKKNKKEKQPPKKPVVRSIPRSAASRTPKTRKLKSQKAKTLHPEKPFLVKRASRPSPAKEPRRVAKTAPKTQNRKLNPPAVKPFKNKTTRKKTPPHFLNQMFGLYSGRISARRQRSSSIGRPPAAVQTAARQNKKRASRPANGRTRAGNSG